jgi:hypothetical protein
MAIVISDGEIEATRGEEMVKVQLGHILAFMTGSFVLPPISFFPRPSIQWDHSVLAQLENGTIPRRRISANTCGNILHIPINEVTIDEDSFITEMNSAIFGSCGFGQV